MINTMIEEINCVTFINAALSQAFYLNKPVHINCPANLDYSNLRKDLPTNIWNESAS